MTIFWNLLLAHLSADFLFHADAIYSLKRRNLFKGVFVHGLIYLACLAVFCAPYLELHWFTLLKVPFNGIEALFLLALIHILSDAFDKSDTQSLTNINALMFLCWQFIEIAILFLATPIIPASENFLPPWGEKLLIALNGAIIVTYFVMVFIHLLMKDIKGKEYPSFDVRYMSMNYRLGIYLSLLVPTKMAYFLAILCGIGILSLYVQKHFEIIPSRLILSTAFAIAIGLMVRTFMYV